MKQILIIAFIIGIAVTCARNRDITGTTDDVNSGQIVGELLKDGKKIDDTVTVSLYYNSDTISGLAKARPSFRKPPLTMRSFNGGYKFDTLDTGTYRIEVTKDSIVIGEQRDIRIDSGDSIEVNITINIIINQTFNIWTDQSQNITINNFYIDNGKVEKSDSGYVLSFAETDTLVFEIEIEKNGETSIVKVRIIRWTDGTTTFEVIEGTDDITVTPGAKGHLGDITIDIEEPGTVDIESTFDTSAVPRKSE